MKEDPLRLQVFSSSIMYLLVTGSAGSASALALTDLSHRLRLPLVVAELQVVHVTVAGSDSQVATDLTLTGSTGSGAATSTLDRNGKSCKQW